jgi:hypothetical protein
MRRPLHALLLTALFCVHCDALSGRAGRPSASPSSPGARCADSATTCLTAPECSYDPKRDCLMCRCGPAFASTPEGMVNSEGIPPVH